MCLIHRFQAALKKYGVPEEEIFQTADLFERRNIPQVTLCLYALARLVSIWHSFHPSLVLTNVTRPIRCSESFKLVSPSTFGLFHISCPLQLYMNVNFGCLMPFIIFRPTCCFKCYWFLFPFIIMGACGVDSSGSEQGPGTRSYENGYEHSDFIKCLEFLEWLCSYWLLNDSAL